MCLILAQYIQPQDAHVLGQAELVIIDEAAAIPLPLVRNLLGPYLVFMASTINGYEGTGRSLSLKLIQQLRESTRPSLTKDAQPTDATGARGSFIFQKAYNKGASQDTYAAGDKTRDAHSRYGAGDKIEKWLNALLCLDATNVPARHRARVSAPVPMRTLLRLTKTHCSAIILPQKSSYNG